MTVRIAAPMTLVILVGFLVPSLGFAQGGSRDVCDMSEHVGSAVNLVQLDKPPRYVLAELEKAAECPKGGLDYDVNYFRAITEMRLARIADARIHAALARKHARDDKARANAANLLRILEKDIVRIKFVLEDGSKEGVSVRLARVDPDTLPNSRKLEALVSPQMASYAARGYGDIIRAAHDKLVKGSKPPITVWLVTGTYTLDTGQELSVSENTTFVLERSKVMWWSKHTFVVGPAVAAVLPFDTDRIATGNRGNPGIVLSYGYRIVDRILLGIEGTYFPASIPRSYQGADDGSLQYDAIESLGTDDAHSAAGALGFGATYASLVGRELPLLVGIYVRGAMVTGLSVSEEKAPLDNRYHAMTWTGVIPTLDGKLFFPMRKDRVEGGIVVGINVGVGLGGFPGGAPDPDPQVYEGTLGEPPDSYPLTLGLGEKMIFTAGLQVGWSFRFGSEE